jgi:hypothetical protein
VEQSKRARVSFGSATNRGSKYIKDVFTMRWPNTRPLGSAEFNPMWKDAPIFKRP